MTRMKDPKTGREQDVSEAAVKDFSHIGWVVVPNEEPVAEKPVAEEKSAPAAEKKEESSAGKTQKQLFEDIASDLDAPREDYGEKYESWNPEKVGEQIVGEVIQLGRQVPTKFGENDLISVKPEDGSDPVTVWNSKMLEKLFQEVSVGDFVGIRFDGRKPSGKGNPYKDFKVSHKKSAPK